MIAIVYALVFLLCVLPRPSFSSILKRSYRRGVNGVGAKSTSHKFMERAKLSRPDLSLKGPAGKEDMHEVVFAVYQNNMDVIKSKLFDVSNPRSPRYGQFMTREEVGALTINTDGSDAVRAYLIANNIEIVSETLYSEYITARAYISVWEDMFKTTFSEYKLSKSEKTHRIASHYSIPVELSRHVHTVLNTIQLPHRSRPVKRSPQQTEAKEESKRAEDGVGGCTNCVDITLLQEFYSIPTLVGSHLSSQAVYASINQSYSTDDLQTFFTTFGIPPENAYNVIGGHQTPECATIDDCIEANLDMQYIMGVSQVTNTTFYYTDKWADWLVDVADMENPPAVFSISYGEAEVYMTSGELNSFDSEAQKLGLMGVTIITASGDNGAPGDNVYGTIDCGYAPDFPSGSPYVTSVGATMGPESGQPEVVCSTYTGGIITSGGGFSNYFPVPDWQAEDVADYLAASKPFYGYNPSGRGYPDISLLGANYIIIAQGSEVSVSGTSASTPAFAAMISLINSNRLKAGKGTVGWINPTLYAYSDRFVNDITSGSNSCTEAQICCEQGYDAAEGWDASTGLGSVNFTSLLGIFMSIDKINGGSAEPTSAPVPTLVPTRNPTVGGGGYLYEYSYADAVCGDSKVIAASGFPTGSCILTDDPTAGPYFTMYDCDEKIASLTYYEDDLCETPFPNATQLGLIQYYYPGACNSMYSEFLVDAYQSSKVFCVENSTFVPPLPSTASYLMAEYYTVEYDDIQYDYDICLDFEMSSYSAFLTDFCYSAYDDYGEVYSYSFSNTTLYQFSDDQCKNKSFYEMFPSECTNTTAVVESFTDEEGVYNFGTFVQYSYEPQYEGFPSSAPTFSLTVSPTIGVSLAPSLSTTVSPTIGVSPSAAPSLAPSVHGAVLVYMEITQVINGLTSAQYYANETINSLTLSETVASSVGNGVTASQVVIVSVADISSSFQRRTLATSSIACEYTITTISISFSSSSAGYASILASLQASITSGDFNSNLESNALTNGAIYLEAAQSGSITQTNNLSPTASPTGSPTDEGMTKGAIAAIVITVLLFVAVVGGYTFYIHQQKTAVTKLLYKVRQPSLASQDQYFSSETTNPVHTDVTL